MRHFKVCYKRTWCRKHFPFYHFINKLNIIYKCLTFSKALGTRQFRLNSKVPQSIFNSTRSSLVRSTSCLLVGPSSWYNQSHLTAKWKFLRKGTHQMFCTYFISPPILITRRPIIADYISQLLQY
jgi:hypothetical protein